jgi:chromosome segregation ATPase
MVRTIISWILIVLSALFLFLSAAGILAAWIFNEPLTRESLERLDKVDTELRLGQSTLKEAQSELERSLRILDASEKALNQFTSNDPEAFFEDVQTTLDDELVPELETARERLIAARDTLDGLRALLNALKFIPFIQIPIPDQTLTDLIASADALESKIGDVGELAEQASKLLSDASLLLGGDFAETRKSLEGFLAAVKEYEEKVTGWRNQVADAKESLPVWIDRASIFLTLFLLWFGLSQFSLLLHGRAILRGENPWEGLWSKK